MYQFWLGALLLPVTPEKVVISCGSKNSVYTCVNGDEIVFPKSGKLKTIKFKALLPNMEYPFARYSSGYREAEYFKTAVENMKKSLKSFRFVITREISLGRVLNYTDMEAVIEDYSFTESAENGYDLIMDITLREYRAFGAVYNDLSQIQWETTRTDNEVKNNYYTVVSGDSLWKIAKRIYGDGSRWKDIFNANTDKITNANAIKTGITLVIP